MRMITVKNVEALSELAAAAILSKMTAERRMNVALTIGSASKRIYKRIIERMKNAPACPNFHLYICDGALLEGFDHTNTYVEMKKSFCDPAKIRTENIHELTTENYKTFDQQIAEAGGLDLIVVSLSNDGHFLGNMPLTTDFDSLCYEVEIKPDYPWYETFVENYRDSGQPIPRSFVTMGPQSVLKAQEVLLIVYGSDQTEALAKMLKGPLTEDFPASVLRLHPNITVIADEEAAKLIN